MRICFPKYQLLIQARYDHQISAEKPGFFRDVIFRTTLFRLQELAWCNLIASWEQKIPSISICAKEWLSNSFTKKLRPENCQWEVNSEEKSFNAPLKRQRYRKDLMWQSYSYWYFRFFPQKIPTEQGQFGAIYWFLPRVSEKLSP